MTQDKDLKDDKTDHADVIMRPPFIYGLAIILALAIHYLTPLAWQAFEAREKTGWAILTIGIGLIIASARLFIKRKQNPNPLEPTEEIYQDGLYAISRNPIYVGFSLIMISLSLLLDNFWIIILLLPTLVIMTYGVIMREEAYLEDKFGDEYRRYKNKVRRWF